jgi:ferrochelatase
VSLESVSPGIGNRAVLLLAHGTPDVLGEMAEYLSKVTGGRSLPEEVVKELQHRYAQIGLRETPGVEAPPLTKWTMTQGYLLEQALGGDKVYVGMRNWHPYIADVVAQMRADGITHIKAVCLAPQNSRTSVGLYRRAVLAAAAGIEVEFVAGWAESPALAEAFAEKLRTVWTEACAEAGQQVPVLFTAHSVPCRTIMTGDASVAGTTLKAIKEQGHAGVVVQPVGFLCDHVEILYDIDIAFRETAGKFGLKLWRTESLNDSPLLVKALVEVVSGEYKATVDEVTVPAGV